MNSKKYIEDKKFNNTSFYYTKLNKKNAGDDYYSPQQEAINNKLDNQVLLVKEDELYSGRTGKSYGSMNINTLEKVWKENHHLYELLTDERKFHLDIEHPELYKNDNQNILAHVFKLIRQCFKTINIDIDNNDYVITLTQGIGEQGVFKDVKKQSYHLILNNNYYFKSVEDINKFSKLLLETAIDNQDKYKCLFYGNNKFVIDNAIYTKNRLFKLPYQSKAYSNRVHIPLKRYRTLDLNKWLVGKYDNDDNVKYYDVSNIKIKGLTDMKEIKGNDGRIYTGQKWEINILMEYLNQLPKNKTIKNEGKTLEDIVMSIYNGKEIDYKIFLAIGMAINRASQGSNEGLKLWKKWTDKYNETPLSELSDKWDTFDSKKGYGIKTLRMLASQCNSKINNGDCSEQLFNINLDDKKIIQKNINVRYIGDNDEKVYDLNKYDTIYIKSPMGTGKSYDLHKLFNEKKTKKEIFNVVETCEHKFKRIIYLSSRRAFACSMAYEFKQEGFINYMSDSFTGLESKIIISPESINKIKHDVYDLVIIDESESVLNIISSETIKNNKFIDNTTKLMNIIKNSNKVIVMDAFLQQRSIDAITYLRTDNKSIYWNNQYKQEEKKLINYDSRDKLIEKLKEKLKENKKCVFVCGNRELAIQINAELQGKYKIMFHHRENKLDNNVNVNELWSYCDLLIYTPTITCGISYTKLYYDELFIYTSNVGSCIPRDLIQSSRRIRKFKNNTIHFCLLNNVIGIDKDTLPLDMITIKENIIDIRRALFKDISPNANEWLLNIHMYNLLENNISRRQAFNVFKRFFEQENITMDKAFFNKIETSKIKSFKNFDYESIENIDNDIYNNILNKIKRDGITMDDSNKILKYNLGIEIKDKNNLEQIYNDYSKGTEYEIKHKRNLLNNIRSEHKFIDKVEILQPKVDVAEFNELLKPQLETLKLIKDNLQITKYNETFNTEHLEELGKQILNKQLEIKNLFKVDISIKKEFKAKDVKMILDRLFINWNGYKIISDGIKKKRVNGKIKSIFKYKFCNSISDKNIYEQF